MASKLTINCDGGSRGNPGPSASAFVVYEGEVLIHKESKYLGTNTNNFAEYTAILMAMGWLKKNYQDEEAKVEFILDSELAVKQLNYIYKLKSPNLIPLFLSIKDIQKSITPEITFRHVLRNSNKEADALLNDELDLHV